MCKLPRKTEAAALLLKGLPGPSHRDAADCEKRWGVDA